MKTRRSFFRAIFGASIGTAGAALGVIALPSTPPRQHSIAVKINAVTIGEQFDEQFYRNDPAGWKRINGDRIPRATGRFDHKAAA